VGKSPFKFSYLTIIRVKLRFRYRVGSRLENGKVQEEAGTDEIPRNFEVAELAKSLVVEVNSRPKSGDFGYIFESHLVIELITARTSVIVG